MIAGALTSLVASIDKDSVPYPEGTLGTCRSYEAHSCRCSRTFFHIVARDSPAHSWNDRVVYKENYGCSLRVEGKVEIIVNSFLINHQRIQATWYAKSRTTLHLYCNLDTKIDSTSAIVQVLHQYVILVEREQKVLGNLKMLRMDCIGQEDSFGNWIIK